ncbi:MAG TPA: hypothetical protein ENJ51_08025 [Leucothrix mucor]|uniref:DUF11 domain-containing protein n=1 Tax=Leucothrix mucor TaxID=45248 RepID=A0A7V2T088_LEUMU|nr:hypothetical protein [Leucothrix mucor]
MKLSSQIILNLLLIIIAFNVQAQGVAAGVVISNTVVVTADGLSGQGLRASTEFIVAEVLNLDLVSLDSEEVAVLSPATNRILTFQLTNSGNGTESFSLATNANLTGDNFDPVVTSIWIEKNNKQGLQDGTIGTTSDSQYGVAIHHISLQADQSVIIYVVSSIPDSLQRSAIGKLILTATSTTAGISNHSVGESIATAGDNGVELVLLKDQGKTEASGAYITNSLTLNMNKSVVSIVDPYGKSRIMPGSTVTYKITITAVGEGIAENLVITDPTPEHMQYKLGSMRLNNVALSDSSDNDQGDFNRSNANTATLILGRIRSSDHYEFLLSYSIN